MASASIFVDFYFGCQDPALAALNQSFSNELCSGNLSNTVLCSIMWIHVKDCIAAAGEGEGVHRGADGQEGCCSRRQQSHGACGKAKAQERDPKGTKYLVIIISTSVREEL